MVIDVVNVHGIVHRLLVTAGCGDGAAAAIIPEPVVNASDKA